MADITDLITRVGRRGTRTALGSPGKQVGDTTINIVSAANWETGTAVIFSMYRINPTTKKEELGTYTIWKGILVDHQITALQLMYGEDQVYPTGDQTVVAVHISTVWANSLVDGVLKGHNPDGTHKDKAIALASLNGGNRAGILHTNTDGVVTSRKVTKDGIDWPTIPMFSATTSEWTTLPSGAWRIVRYNNEYYDTADMFDPETFKATIPVTGIYNLNVRCAIASGGHSRRTRCPRARSTRG